MNSSGSSTTSSGVTKPRARTTTSISKLRDCCLGCATSKVRCSREKPACSRCVKRNVSCEYLASRRAGRKHDTSNDYAAPSSTASSTNEFNMDDMDGMGSLNFAFPATVPFSTTTPDTVSSDSSTLGSCFTSNASTTATTMGLDENFLFSPSGLATDGSFETTTSTNVPQPYLDLLSSSESENSDSPFTPFLATEKSDESKMLSVASAANSIFNDPLASDFNVGYAFDFGSNSSSDNIPSSLISSPEALVTNGLFGFSATTPQTPPPSPPVKIPQNLNRPGNNQLTNEPNCTCLTQALSLMKQLFPHPPTFCTTSATSGDSSPPLLHASNIPTVLERNRHTVQAVSAMLSCPCSQDVHLLSVLAHIAFKVLEWYELACARRTPSTPPATPVTPRRPSSGSSHSSRGYSRGHSRNQTSTTASYLEQVCRQLDHVDSSAQLVLNDLHRVQKLVNQLAARLKTQGGIEQPTGKTIGDGEMLMPFSGAILDLLGVDLRKRFKEVSNEVVRSLKRA